jgi:hypothetical protein
MAKKTPTNFGQTGIIEEVGFFRGDKKTAEEIEGFKKELTDRICEYIRGMKDGEEATLFEIAGKLFPQDADKAEPLLMDVYYDVRDALEEELTLDISKHSDMIVGMPYDIPFEIVRIQEDQRKKTWFAYALQDAWGMELSVVEVRTDSDKKNRVYYWSKTEKKPFYLSELAKKAELDDAAMEQIKTLLADDRIYEMDELEGPPDIVVMDGYAQDFVFSDGTRKKKIRGYNIRDCKGEYEKCPNSALVLDLLEELSEILVPLGVYKKCFYPGSR